MFDLTKLPSQFNGYDITLTFQIIESFNFQTEMSILNSLDDYRDIGPESVDIQISPEEDFPYQTIDHYMGLYSNDVDLDNMFKDYYPSVTRRSAFLTMYGMLEHDFEKLCNAYTVTKQSNIKLSHLRGSGFERGDLFARTIMGMKSSKHFSVIKKITKLRNLCAHNDARFLTNDNQEINEAVDLMREYPELFGKDGNQVNFKAGCLDFFKFSFRNYFNDVEQALLSHSG